jgi:ribose/xylose/arabinose/galactoside ABC-type transport system permease subunit
LQGIAVAWLRMPAFLVSLSTLMFGEGLAVWYTHSTRIPVPADFVELWYGRCGPIPAPFVVVGMLAILAHVLLRYTVFGRYLYAVGHSYSTAVIAGVPVQRTIIAAYMWSGACAGLAGVFYSARLYTGSPELVEHEVLLDCIAAAVLGGVSLFGGKGHVSGLLLGVLFISLVSNSLNLLGLRYWDVIMVKGGVILLAALLDTARNRWSQEG